MSWAGSRRRPPAPRKEDDEDVDRQEIGRAAATILEARREGRRLSGLPRDLAPRTLDEGFAVQEAVIAASGERVAGWKIACTARHVQELFRVETPFFGAVFEPAVFASPATVGARTFTLGCVESEVAFRVSEDLVPRRKPYAREELADAVDAVLPAFELIEPRFDSLLTDAAPLAFADCALNGGLVLGAAVAAWRQLDLAALPVVLSIDGVVAAEGRGADALGHPLAALEWLANALSDRGLPLTAGQVVATGTCTGINYIRPGQTAVGDFGPLGTVQVTLA